VNVISAIFANPEGTILKVDLGAGHDVYVPWPCENRYQKPIQDWLDAGNSFGADSDPAPQPQPRLIAIAARSIDLMNTRFSRELSATENAELLRCIDRLKALGNGQKL
jgi:hypothetical protein